MINPYLDSFFLVLSYMVIMYVIAQVRRDNSLADIAWGPGFVLVANWIYIWYNYPQHSLMVWMVNLWGIRLFLHLLIRSWGKGEDWRYQKMREEWGEKAEIIAFYKVFLLQGFFMWIIALPLMQTGSQAAGAGSGISILHILGVLLWAIGFFYEALADWQLLRFKASPNNDGKVMDKGLWKYSRHPNYFGEILLWWGIFIYTLPYGIWYVSILSPITITWLLVRVSGVPMLEEKAKKNPAYREYAENTPALIPGLW